MKKQLFTFVFAVLSQLMYAQTYTPTTANLESRKVFEDMRFGMFIHWGPFSIPGSGEWVMNQRNITVKNYTRLEDFFNPISFDAAKYVSTAKSAGMKYITLITRHHDGFSMWDTKYSDFNIMHTPYKKDIVKLIADECHKQGIKLVLYYSLLDWRRDDYSYWTGNTGQGTGRTVHGDWNNYIKFMKNQLTELLTNYGEIEGIWFDGYWDQVKKGTKEPQVDWHTAEIYTLIHKLQPKCLVGNNHHSTPLPGEDFQMFEKDLPGGNTTGFGGAAASSLPLETCETMNDSWGFNITDTKYKSVPSLIHYMVNAAGYNANFLLNIGPMPNGAIQPEFIDTLKNVGQWMKANGATIYGTRGNLIPQQSWGTVTMKNKTIYVHILKPVGNKPVYIPNITQKVLTAMLFGNKHKVRYEQQNGGVTLYLDDVVPDKIDTIIQLEI
ncbi:alpha-L-fucosidase [Mucilaginibacter boryungensis]|uniref:alpha-L-fucosidase n=1 Tax=Mucilaginibacter boryungensis TaxID=768480 RepID=A0ABR9XFA6_9SPHI|nr:alpha-L-fucosidase [Mucilaginibacter boryungensis]MBE9665865.1 alpha-L-fucosidase [Mucilaginibacter boryungensis]